MTGEVVNIIKMFTQSNSVRGGLSVEPEPDPGENDNESTGQIHLNTDKFLRKVLIMNSPELENIPCVAVTEKLLAERTMIQLVRKTLNIKTKKTQSGAHLTRTS